MKAMLESLLLGEALIPFAKLQVGDISIQTLRLTQCQIGIAVIIAVRTELSALEIARVLANDLHILFGSPQHGSQIFMILAARSLGMHDDLVLAIYQCLSVVALDHSMGGGHLCGLVIRH